MALPIRTTLEDIDELTAYLVNKPTGATIEEAKAVLDSKRLDTRKLSAMRYWGLLEQDPDDRLILTPTGRELARGESWRRAVFSQVIRNIPAYMSIIERAHMKKEESISSTDVAANWFQHFKTDASTDSNKILNDQALCFFHLAVGAELGTMVQGRLGKPTRLAFNQDNLQGFVTGHPSTVTSSVPRTTSKPQVSVPLPPLLRAKVPRIGAGLDGVESPRSLNGQNDTNFLQRGVTVDCYTLVERLGSGFSAEVWSADVSTSPPGVDLKKDDKVAVKFYTANALAVSNQVIRIEREYRVAQRLRHPHLIRIYEFMIASPRPNHSFLVMDIDPGPTLSSLMKTRKFEPSESIKILAQLLSAADALHEVGALHRDIKPGNISLSGEEGSPHVVLLDLGIVSPLFEKSVTAVSRFVGSKHWAPLEQLVGRDLDQRSDLYSIGAVAYNLLMGVEPFTGSPTEAAVAVEMSQNGLKIPELANLPSEIVQLFNACLSNKQADRPRSAAECLAILRRHGIEA